MSRVALACRALSRPRSHPFHWILTDAPGAREGPKLTQLPGRTAARPSWLALAARDTGVPEPRLEAIINYEKEMAGRPLVFLPPSQVFQEMDSEGYLAGATKLFQKKAQRWVRTRRCRQPQTVKWVVDNYAETWDPSIFTFLPSRQAGPSSAQPGSAQLLS